VKGGAKRLSNDELGVAVRGTEHLSTLQKEYLTRLDRMKMGHKCDGGHLDCAIVAQGPCSAEMKELGY